MSTRGYYETSWRREVRPTAAHGTAEYDLEGTIPGLDGTDPPAEMLLIVHGWLSTELIAEGIARVARTALRENGYEAPVIGFSWDADTVLTRWGQAREIAERNGHHLAAFLQDYLEEVPDTRVRLLAHSLGARVVLSMLDNQLPADHQDRLRTISLLGAAVHDREVARGERFGATLERTDVRVENYHSRADKTLRFVYSLAEWEAAVGQTGCRGVAPAGYTDHDVTDDVSTHVHYLLPGRGCMDQVVSDFE